MTTTYPLPPSPLLADPDVITEETDEPPFGQCTWCQIENTPCVLVVEWLPRPDVMSDGWSASCLACVESPLRWALDDALTGSTVRATLHTGSPTP
ncbi:hypothetical protein [Saccharopolyspora sp. 6V]|uniref:hypothetical protein n=1 Tax=Saccharopolyspora sp. 6V TaxID=2877239 RepID=UPI001CD32EE8|nr:hypothetical protein [Saccharopolyspora sp. 6V]MCA1195104.1 hypothetical protein [Saccharopolyspora sp. 6V]